MKDRNGVVLFPWLFVGILISYGYVVISNSGFAAPFLILVYWIVGPVVVTVVAGGRGLVYPIAANLGFTLLLVAKSNSPRHWHWLVLVSVILATVIFLCARKILAAGLLSKNRAQRLDVTV